MGRLSWVAQSAFLLGQWMAAVGGADKWSPFRALGGASGPWVGFGQEQHMFPSMGRHTVPTHWNHALLGVPH